MGGCHQCAGQHAISETGGCIEDARTGTRSAAQDCDVSNVSEKNPRGQRSVSAFGCRKLTLVLFIALALRQKERHVVVDAYILDTRK